MIFDVFLPDAVIIAFGGWEVLSKLKMNYEKIMNGCLSGGDPDSRSGGNWSGGNRSRHTCGGDPAGRDG